MIALASQITGVTMVYSTVCSGADKKTSKLRATTPRRIHFKGIVTRKKFPFDDVIMFMEGFVGVR